jgi:replicative DNA helicase
LREPEPTQNSEALPEFANAEWESVLLANYFVRPEVRSMMAAELEVTDFTVMSHRELFRVIKDINGVGGLDVIAVRLNDEKRLDSVGGFHGLMRIHSEFLEIADLSRGIHVLRKKTIDREAYLISQIIAADCTRGFTSSTDSVREAQARLSKLEQQLVTHHSPETLGAALEEAGGLQALLGRPTGQITTPWGCINKYINGGLQRGEFWIVAARGSIGKGVTALELALHAAGKLGKKTYIASLEMSKEMMLKRAIARMALIDLGDVMAGTLGEDERYRAITAMRSITDYPITLDDESVFLNDVWAKISKGNMTSRSSTISV